MTVIRLAIAISCIAASMPAYAQSSFEGAGGTTELDCDGGTATIEGASNIVTVTGQCTLLIVEGAGNRVQVDLAPNGEIRVVGASNEVVWTTPDGSKARVSITGADNRVSNSR